MTTEPTPSERLLLAREVAADSYQPPAVADEEDIRRIPRDSFAAGWDAAMAHVAAEKDDEDGYDDDAPTISAVLSGPTSWNAFVDNLSVRRCYD